MFCKFSAKTHVVRRNPSSAVIYYVSNSLARDLSVRNHRIGESSDML